MLTNDTMVEDPSQNPQPDTNMSTFKNINLPVEFLSDKDGNPIKRIGKMRNLDGSKNAVVYMRVSTLDQKLEMQEQDIIDFCRMRNLSIIRTFSDKLSGKNIDRPGFQDMMKFIDVHHPEIDVFVIWKLDRVCRNLQDLCGFITHLTTLNVATSTTSGEIDTTTPSGIMAYQISGCFAEYERKLICERTSSGRLRAIEKGVKFGRKKKPFDYDAFKVKRALGIPMSKIAKDLDMKRSTLYVKVNEYEEKEKLNKKWGV